MFAYEPSTNECLPLTCSDNCATCVEQPDYCVTCKTGQVLIFEQVEGSYETGRCECPSPDQTYVNDVCECPQGTTLNDLNRCACPNVFQTVDAATQTCQCPANSYADIQVSATATAAGTSATATTTLEDVCICGVTRGDGLNDILILDYDTVNNEYFCRCYNWSLVYNEDLRRCECANGFVARAGTCVCEAPRALRYDTATNTDICDCPGDNQVYDETNQECKCDDRNGYTMDTAGVCVFTPVANCAVQTGPENSDCISCVEGINYDQIHLPGESPCQCGYNQEYRDYDEFGNDIAPGCYCVPGRTGANCDETTCYNYVNTCDFCYESYPDHCLRCKANHVEISAGTYDFNQLNLHDHPIVECPNECVEGYKWDWNAETCVAMTCDAKCAPGKCVYAESLCTQCTNSLFSLHYISASELEVYGAPTEQSFEAGNCECLEGYREETINNGTGILASYTCVLKDECYFKCATCYQFNDPLSCLTCNDEYILEQTGLLGGRCVLPSNIGDNYYIDDSDPNNLRLVQCDSRCNGCFGPTNYECEACLDETQYRYSDLGCQCPGCQEWTSTTVAGSTESTWECRSLTCDKQGFYGPTCTDRCDLSCSCCEGAGADQCLGCRDNAYLAEYTTTAVGTDGSRRVGYCECYWSYYKDTETGECEQCNVVCNKCTGSGKAQCDSNYCNWPAHARTDGNDGCACPADMRATTNREQPCECTSSTQTFDPTTGHCVNNDTGCFDGFYAVNGECRACEWPCLTCSNADTCNECYNPFQPSTVVGFTPFFDYLKNCSCKDGYYFNYNECMQCTSPCLTCYGSMWDTCTSCNQYRVLEQETCQCDGANPNRSARSVVSPMMIAEFLGDYASIEANASATGTAADNSFYTVEDICLVFTACANDGQYRDEHTGECVACDSSCGECVGPSLAHCTMCPHGTHLVTWNADVFYGACRCDKAEHYYEAATGECLPCGSACHSCSNGQSCLACNDFASLGTDGQCYCNDNGAAIAQDCIPDVTICPNHCLNCDTGICCEQCMTGYTKNRDGVCTCPAGYYENYYNNTEFECLSCPANCSSCRGDICLACNEGAMLSNQNCRTCSNDYAASADGICQRTGCPDGTYTDSAGECVDCGEENCKKCSEACEGQGLAQVCELSCDECMPGMTYVRWIFEQTSTGGFSERKVECTDANADLDGTDCQCECLERGYFWDTYLNECRQCSPGCMDCDSNCSCNFCYDGWEFTSENR